MLCTMIPTSRMLQLVLHTSENVLKIFFSPGQDDVHGSEYLLWIGRPEGTYGCDFFLTPAFLTGDWTIQISSYEDHRLQVLFLKVGLPSRMSYKLRLNVLQIREKNKWEKTIQPGGKYHFTRSDILSLQCYTCDLK